MVASAKFDSIWEGQNRVIQFLNFLTFDLRYISIDTLEGKENMFPTDILARGVNGELYPIKKENFDIIFEVL